MADAEMLRRLALALPGTTEAAHVDRRAFRARIIYATLAPDGRSANLKLSAEEQAFRCEVLPEAFAPVPGGWGRMGFTTVTLAAVEEETLRAALEAAWRGAVARPRPRPRGRQG